VCHDCVTRTPHHSSHETCVLPVYLTFFITSNNQAAHAVMLPKLPDRKSLSCRVDSSQKLHSTSLLCFWHHVIRLCSTSLLCQMTLSRFQPETTQENPVMFLTPSRMTMQYQPAMSLAPFIRLTSTSVETSYVHVASQNSRMLWGFSQVDVSTCKRVFTARKVQLPQRMNTRSTKVVVWVIIQTQGLFGCIGSVVVGHYVMSWNSETLTHTGCWPD